ncbi:MAG: xylulokinase [Anaerolineae bacterium]
MDRLLLGVDVGTTGTKAALFTPDGRLQAVGQSEYSIHHEHPGWAEQDPEDWWRATCIAIRQALAQVPESPKRVAGIAVSSQATTLLPLNRAGQPVRPAMIWMDRRAEAEARRLSERLGESVIERVSGNRSDPFYVASKLLWFRTHEPDRFAETHIFVQANGYVSYRLTNEHAMDNAHAGLLQLRNWQTGSWSPELCEACGVDPDRFPPIHPAHHVQGEVTPDAARATGLVSGTPVMLGTVDSAAAAIEAGVVDPGVAAEMTGTSTVLIIPDDGRVAEPAFITMPHAVSGIHLLLGALAASGASLRWYRDQFGLVEINAGAQLGVDSYELLTMQAARVAPGSRGVIFLPYMMGERSPIWHTNARGVFFGLSLDTPRAALIRAILEGTAFALQHNVKTAQQAGVTLNEIRSVGGGTRSSLWNQIKADVLGLPILLPQVSVGAAFGSAVLVGMGLGLYPDVRRTLHEMVQPGARYEPDPDNHALYQELYQVFRSIYESLREDFDRAAAIWSSV